MKISQVPTGHILVKAGCTSEWDNCDFAIIDCNGWKERISKWIEAAASFITLEDLISLQFYDNCVDFYVSDENEAGIPSEDWAFIELEEDEEERFNRPENRLEAATLVLYPNGSGFYKSYGKYSNEEFYTQEVPLGKVLEQIKDREEQQKAVS